MAMNPLGRKLDKNGNPIVSKKELEDSGMSLRDFLNNERGLKKVVKNSDLEPPNIDSEAGMSRGRRDYVTSGKKSFDTETEFVPPDMSNYKPRREPKPLTEVMKPGTRTNYENMETSDMMKAGGKVSSASRRADGMASRGKTRGKLC